MKTCSICKQLIQCSNLGNRDAYAVDCPNCGQYSITRSAHINLQNQAVSSRQIANMAGWLRENQNFELSTSNVDSLLNLKTPSFHEKADKFILRLDKLTEYAGEELEQETNWLNYAWCVNKEELGELISYLKYTERIKMLPNLAKAIIKILPNGWQHIEKLKSVNPESNQGFVAMWFSSEMQDVYNESISVGIIDAGYRPHKVDQREHNEKVDDEIIAQIRRSRFVLADFTGHRGGVYFEAGFARGMNIEVIWSCRNDDLDNLHFDIRQYNCIVWDQGNLKDFRSRISHRIEAVLGRGSYQEK